MESRNTAVFSPRLNPPGVGNSRLLQAFSPPSILEFTVEFSTAHLIFSEHDPSV